MQEIKFWIWQTFIPSHITFFMNPKTLPTFVFMLDSLPFLTAPFLKLMLDGTPFLSPDLAPSPLVLQYLLLSIGNCFHISIASTPEYPWVLLNAILPLILLPCLGAFGPPLAAILSVVSFFFHSNFMIVEIWLALHLGCSSVSLS